MRTNRIVALVVALWLGLGLGRAQTTLSGSLLNGLDLFLPLNGTGVDPILGSAAQLNDLAFGWDTNGNPAAPLIFSGAQDQLALVQGLPSLTASNITVAGWLQTTNLTAIMQVALKTHYADSSDEQWSIYLDGLNHRAGTLVFAAKHNSGGRSGVGWYYATGQTPLPLAGGAWVFFAVTWDGTLAQIYINGEPTPATSQIPAGGIDTFPTGDLVLGVTSYSNVLYPYSGNMEDIVLYERALSAAEIAQLYLLNPNSSPLVPPASVSASATARVDNGFVVGITVVNPGFAYTNPPNVHLLGGGGHGATAVAILDGGEVASVLITNPGSGYTSAPLVSFFAGPVPPPEMSLTVASVTATFHVTTGAPYEIDASPDMFHWTTVIPAFFAPTNAITRTLNVSTNATFFRIVSLTP